MVPAFVPPIEWVNMRRGGLAAFDAAGALVFMIQGNRRVR